MTVKVNYIILSIEGDYDRGHGLIKEAYFDMPEDTINVFDYCIERIRMFDEDIAHIPIKPMVAIMELQVIDPDQLYFRE